MDIKTINETIIKLENIHKNNPLIKTYCIVGSYPRNKSKSHDIDCIFITRQKTSNAYYLKKLPNLIKEKVSIIRSDDSLRLFIKDTEFSLVYFLESQFYKLVNDIISGNTINIASKPWVIGGKIPEVLLTDIVFADIKFDKENRFINLRKKLINDYPRDLRNSLFKVLGEELNLKIKMVEESLINEDYLKFELGFGEIILICIRLAFAKKNSYMPPIKHLTDGLYRIPKFCQDYLKEILLILQSNNRGEKIRLIKKLCSKLESKL